MEKGFSSVLIYYKMNKIPVTVAKANKDMVASLISTQGVTVFHKDADFADEATSLKAEDATVIVLLLEEQAALP